MFDFKKLQNWDYLTDPRPGAAFAYLKPSLIAIGIMFFIAIFLPILIKKETRNNPIYIKLAKKFSFAFGVTAFAALVMVFFRIENLPILSMRIMFVFLGVVFLGWIGYIFYWAKKNVKRELMKIESQKRKEKYLPKKRK